MDDSPVKGLTSPMFFKNVGNNENDESGSSKLEKSKKPVRKHFMSPTISAAQKAAALVPRKKILADRNEGFSFTIGSAHSIRSNCSSENDCDDEQISLGGDSVLEKKILAERNEGPTFSISPRALVGSAHSIRSNCSSGKDCDDDQNSFEGVSVLEKKPYDPLTNYLSPRPKFLRYNPNKKRRIFPCGEDEIGKMKDGLGFVSTSSSFEFQEVVGEMEVEEGAVKKGDKELEMTESECNVEEKDEAGESEEFEEEEKEEKCWSFLGVLKFLLVLSSLFLSTAFIYSMDSPDSLLTREAVWDSRGVFVNQSNVHEEVVSRKEYVISKFEVMDGKGEETDFGLLHVVTQNDLVDNVFAEAGIYEDNGNDNGMLDSISIFPQATIERFEDIYNDELMRKAEASDTLPWAEANESEDNTDIKVIHSEAEVLDCRGNECIRNQGIERIEEAFDQVQRAETVEVYESFQKNLLSETEPSNDTLPWAEPQVSEDNTKCEVVHSETEGLDSRVNECTRNQEIESTEAFDQVQSAETLEVFKSFHEDLFSEIEPSTELNAETVMMESEEIKLQFEVLILAIFFSIVAALGFLYQSRQRNTGKAVSFLAKKNNIKENSLPMETQHQNAEPVIVAHQIHNSNAICGVKEEKMKKTESIVSPKTPFPQLKEVTEEFSRQSQAPIVELLGELVIGEAANGSSKSNKRRRALASEVKNGSNHLFTETTISHRKAPLVQDQRYSPQFELSNASDSSSQKKKSVSKKEEGRSGEVSMASSTPVRRSSRIRNKAISPC